jgi:PAS domain S-box-containing protein
MGEQNNSSGAMPERRILIVDDDRDFADSLADVLQQRGYTPAVTSNEKEALARIKEFQAQVALLDIRLGQGSGIELIHKMRGVRPATLCIMMTAYVEIDTAIEAIHQGAYDYLRKPINVDDLLTTLARCFDKIRLEEEKAGAQRALKAANRELNEINARLRDMVESTRGLAACSYINDLGPLLLEEFAQNMAANGGSMYLRDADNLKRVHALDPGHSPDIIPFPPKKGSILEMAMDKGQPVLIQDIRNEDGIASSGWSGYEDDSLLVFLLLDEKEDIEGFITLHNRQPPPFTYQDLELGTLLTSYSCEKLRATQAIEALREREAEYRKLFNNLPDVFYRTDLEGKIVMASPAIGNLLGSDMEEISGTNVRDYYLYPQKRDELLELLSEKESVDGFEFQLKRKDAAIIWASVNAHYFRDEAHNIIGVEGIIRDVTERKKSEEAHMRLATAVEQAAELILITDTDGTIQYVNPSYERVTGYTREELIGKNSRILKSGKHDQAFYKDLWDTIRSGDVWRGRIINKTKSGCFYQEEATITPIRDSAGNIINFVGVKRDVTRESMLEKQLQQAQKMEAIGTLAGGIAHDFNNITILTIYWPLFQVTRSLPDWT